MTEPMYCVQIGFDLLPLQQGEATKVLQAMQGDKDTLVILSCGVFRKSAISGIREDVYTPSGLPLQSRINGYIFKEDFKANISGNIQQLNLLDSDIPLTLN